LLITKFLLKIVIFKVSYKVCAEEFFRVEAGDTEKSFVQFSGVL